MGKQYRKKAKIQNEKQWAKDFATIKYSVISQPKSRREKQVIKGESINANKHFFSHSFLPELFIVFVSEYRPEMH